MLLQTCICVLSLLRNVFGDCTNLEIGRPQSYSETRNDIEKLHCYGIYILIYFVEQLGTFIYH